MLIRLIDSPVNGKGLVDNAIKLNIMKARTTNETFIEPVPPYGLSAAVYGKGTIID